MPSAADRKKAEEHYVRLSIQSRLESVRLLANMAGAVCDTAGFSATERHMIVLCLVEAANNAIIHAYEEDPEQSLDVEIRLSNEHLTFDVLDTGKRGDPAIMNADHRSALHGKHEGELAENGRGLAIMQEAMDSVEYSCEASCNRLRLVKRLRKTGTAHQV